MIKPREDSRRDPVRRSVALFSLVCLVAPQALGETESPNEWQRGTLAADEQEGGSPARRQPPAAGSLRQEEADRSPIDAGSAVLAPEESYRAPVRRSFPRTALLVDPLNLLIFGRLDLALAVEVTPKITLFLRSGWVVDTTPPGYNFEETPRTIRVESGGLGPLATWATGAAYWLGQPFDSFSLRAFYEGGYYRVSSEDDAGRIDQSTVPLSRLMVGAGITKSYGHFLIGAGVALGAELRSVDRCPEGDPCPTKDGNYLRTDRAGTLVNLEGPLAPLAMELTFNLGFQF